MQLPDSVQNILAYGQGYTDGMKDGHICGFHDALVCNVHDLTVLLKKYHEMEKEYAGLQEKARRERMENMPKFEQPAEQKHGSWQPFYKDHGIKYFTCSECGLTSTSKCNYCSACGARMDAGEDQGGGADNE